MRLGGFYHARGLADVVAKRSIRLPFIPVRRFACVGRTRFYTTDKPVAMCVVVVTEIECPRAFGRELNAGIQVCPADFGCITVLIVSRGLALAVKRSLDLLLDAATLRVVTV